MYKSSKGFLVNFSYCVFQALCRRSLRSAGDGPLEGGRSSGFNRWNFIHKAPDSTALSLSLVLYLLYPMFFLHLVSFSHLVKSLTNNVSLSIFSLWSKFKIC